MAILTTGIIFFVLGFIFYRRRTGNVTYTPSHKVTYSSLVVPKGEIVPDYLK